MGHICKMMGFEETLILAFYRGNSQCTENIMTVEYSVNAQTLQWDHQDLILAPKQWFLGLILSQLICNMGIIIGPSW